jgi:hypothetical protein
MLAASKTIVIVAMDFIFVFSQNAAPEPCGK